MEIKNRYGLLVKHCSACCLIYFSAFGKGRFLEKKRDVCDCGKDLQIAVFKVTEVKEPKRSKYDQPAEV